MTSSNRLGLLLAGLLVLVIPGCGGGEDSGATEAESEVPPAVVARANATCRHFVREIKQIGTGALARGPETTNLELTTENLVKPSIPLLERVGKQQQALQKAAHNPWFDLYAELFDPIVALAKQRQRSGEADDFYRSRDLEELLTNLGLEQMEAARNAGVRDCNVDFQNVLLSSLSG
jgi:hypothetical protein